MSDWQFKLNVGDFYHKFDNDEMTIQEISKKMAERIVGLVENIRNNKTIKSSLYHYSEFADELENDILPMFEEVAENEDSDIDDFNYAMEDLYDWADTPLDNKFGGAKMCWIETYAR